jgi:hypothetical protein
MAGFIEVDAPDGSVVEFPDTMSQQQIRNVMRTKFPPTGASQDVAPAETPEPVAAPAPEVLTRNEGFVSDAARFMGFDPHTDQNDDTVIKMTPRRDPLGLNTIIPDPAFSVVKGGRDLVSGLLNLPGDVKEFVTGENGWEVDIPEFRGGPPENIAAGVLQFGVPGLGAASKAAQVVKAVAPNVGSFTRGLASLFAGAGADALVVDTQNEKLTGLGNLIPGFPTAIEPDDTGLERRAKTAAEALALGGVMDAAVRTGGAITRPFRRGKASEVRTDSRGNEVTVEGSGQAAHIENKLADELQGGVVLARREGTQKEAIDRAVANIDDSVARSADDGFQPSTGTASNDPYLLGLEKAQVTSPEGLARATENRTNISETIAEATNAQRMASPETAVDAIRANQDAALAAKQTEITAGEQALKTADDANAQQGADLALNRGGAPDASIKLDEQLVDLSRGMTRTKSEKYDAIDPQGRVQLPASNPMSDAITNLRANTNPKIMADVDTYAKGVLDELSKPLSFKDMNDLRGALSGAINKAKIDKQGHVVERLVAIKAEYENVITQLSRTPGSIQAGKRAERATAHFRDEFVPIQREGVGGDVAQSIKVDPSRSKASQTARKYLGSPEGADQLARTIAKVKDPKAAAQAVRDHIFAETAAAAVKADGTINPAALTKIIETRKSVLRNFPEVRDELLRLRNQAESGVKLGDDAKSALDQAKADLKMTEVEHSQSAARLMLDGDDPVDAVGRAMTSNVPKRKMAEIREAIGDNEQAQEGLKSATRQWVARRVKGLAETGGDAGQRAVSLKGMSTVLDDPKTREALLASGISPAELKQLEGAYARIREMARIDRKVTAGSDTVANIAASSQRVRVLAASYFGIVKGRGVFQITQMIQNIMGANPKGLAEDSVNALILDPKFAKMLLLKDTNAHRVRMKTYLTNNLPELMSREDGDEE